MSSNFSRRTFTLTGATLLTTGWGAMAHGKCFSVQDQDTQSAAPPAQDDGVKVGPVEDLFERDYPAPDFKPGWKKKQINRMLAQDFVIYAHSDVKMVEQLYTREPALLNATLDWGGGDWETALGGASHMGRKDIVTFLLSKGARIDIFCAAMLGMLDTIRQMLTFQPTLIDAKGPHGFSLHFHAQVGQEDSKPVLDYLQSIKEIELKPVPFLNKK